jgi:hypothetical protein
MDMLLRYVCSATLAVAAFAFACPAQADTVADWYEASSALGGQARSQVALAMFEAANAVDRRYESYLGFPAASVPANADVAVAVAAHGVLRLGHPTQAAVLQASLDFDLGQVPDGPAKSAGIAVGQAAADAVMKRVTQSAGVAPDYVPATAPGVYVSTDLPVLSMGAYLAKGWFLAKPDEFKPKPPPALKSAEWARAYDEVRRLGRRTGSERTPWQTAAANFWSSNDPELAMRLLAFAPGRSLVQSARLYAKVGMGMADAHVSMSVAKYDYHFWRPITAIRNGAVDGNPKTDPDAAWEPLIRTPLHPEYPCGHCIMASVVATILAAEFGKDAKLTFDDPTMPGSGQVLTPDAYVQAVSMSRIYAGVHYRFSNEAAEEMGRKIGERAVADFMRPLAR